MATFSIVISNSISVFGPAQSDKWGEHNWNAFIWGEGTAGLPKTVAKLLTETITPTDSLSKTPAITISNTLTPVGDMGSEKLYDSDGYSRLFPGGTAEAESRVGSTWASPTPTAPSWTSGAASATSWSDA